MAVFTNKQRKLTKKLITTVTGFRVEEKNFKICFRFCSSNFMFHRFLCVNDLDIRRKIDGLEEKFIVHSMEQKAHHLRRLTEVFLSGCLEDSYPRSDAHYGTLSFLLCLSESPIHASYQPSLLNLSGAESEVEWFDWTSYLIEGIEYESSESDSSEWSDDEVGVTAPVVSTHLNDSAIVADAPDGPVAPGNKTTCASKDWLLENIVVPYWDRQFQTPGPSTPSSLAHPACWLTQKWEGSLASLGPIYQPTSDLFLKEWQLVRETIWVMVGVEQSFVYKITETEVKVRPGIRLTHLTSETLYQLLQEFAACATKLRLMRRFCWDVLLGLPPFARCRTYEAFASGLQRCLHQLLRETRRYEKELVLKNLSLTLLELRERHALTFQQVDDLYQVFQKGLTFARAGQSVDKCSCGLLNVLWACLGSCDMLGMSGIPLLKLILPLWLEASRPYMDILHTFVTMGAIQDLYEEFCIVRSSGISMEGDSDYWEQIFLCRENATPTFLQPTLELVMMAGKSRHLMGVISAGRELSPQTTSLLVQSFSSLELEKVTPSFLIDHLSLDNRGSSDVGSRDATRVAMANEGVTESDHHSSSSPRSDISGHPSPPLDEASQDDESERNAHYDALMRTYITHLQEMGIGHKPPGGEEALSMAAVERVVENPRRCLLGPLRVLVQDLIHSHFRQHYKKVSQSLVELLRSEFNVCEHLEVLRQFFLFGSGATLHHLTSHVFQREVEGEAWFSRDFLSAVLNEALHYTHPGAMAALDSLEQNLSLTPPTDPTLPPPSLCLNYSVPSPLSMLFSTPVLSSYNEIFRFLLHLHWAKWSLEMPVTRKYLATPTGGSVSWHSKSHLLFLLRNKLLFFVNTLNTYIMTKMMGGGGVDIQERISTATDLEGMIHEHASYLQTHLDHCFLNHKVNMVHKAVTDILNMGVEFRRGWERGVARFDLRAARELEEGFTKRCHFLVSCLNLATRRGSFLYLEMLEFALEPLKTADKIFSNQNCAHIASLS